MNKLFLIFPLAALLFATQGWAPPPGKGGATGGQDVSKCDLKPKEQTKITLKDKAGKVHYICTGIAVCGGQSVPVSCRVSEREACPMASKCISFSNFHLDTSQNLENNDEVLIYDLPDRIQESDRRVIERGESSMPWPMPEFEDKIENPFEFIELKTKKNPTYLAEPLNLINYFGEQGQKAGKGVKVQISNPFLKPIGKYHKYINNKYAGACSGSTISLDPKGKKTGSIAVVTAAHCLMNPNRTMLINKAEFTPMAGLKDKLGNPENTKAYAVRSIVFPANFIKRKDFSFWNFDFAILILDEIIPTDFCCYGLIANGGIAPGLSLGYPSVPGTDFQGDLWDVLIKWNGIKTGGYQTGQRKVYYKEISSNLDTGISGGPWIGSNSDGSKYGYIIGINSRVGPRGKRPRTLTRSSILEDWIIDVINCAKVGKTKGKCKKITRLP
ncbi:MAG: hypothetical protein DRQ88_00055 [Epsilonproteobacteria bacterium]|nr:MAG: hypothetical protein DRQ89_10700 [Campylobacterota bacterium]RLA68029.1 MAG: hypothetical protein DRQ88_00055 [Campylobacterota bacterium]